MRRQSLGSIAGAVLLCAPVYSQEIEVVLNTRVGQQGVMTTFEGGANNATIYQSEGGLIPFSQMVFDGNWRTIIDSDAVGGTGPFGNLPSPDTAAVVTSGASSGTALGATVDFVNPVSGVTMFYASADPDGDPETGPYSGDVSLVALDALGNTLASVSFGPNNSGSSTDPDFYSTWDQIEIDLTSMTPPAITRIIFTGPDGFSGIDNLEWFRTGATLQLGIDIKPGSFPNSINLGSKGVTPVAIFSTATFDATQVDPLSVRMEDAVVKVKGNGTPQASFQDVDGDGLLDLVLQLETEGLSLTSGDVSAQLDGALMSGELISGTDSVRVVP